MTILSLYWDRLYARGLFWGVLVAFIAGIPLFVYGNIMPKLLSNLDIKKPGHLKTI